MHPNHYRDVITGTMASHITSLTIVYSTVYSGAYRRKHQSTASLAFVRGIHRGTGEFPAQMASNAENVSIWWRHHDNVAILSSSHHCCPFFNHVYSIIHFWSLNSLLRPWLSCFTNSIADHHIEITLQQIFNLIIFSRNNRLILLHDCMMLSLHTGGPHESCLLCNQNNDFLPITTVCVIFVWFLFYFYICVEWYFD